MHAKKIGYITVVMSKTLVYRQMDKVTTICHVQFAAPIFKYLFGIPGGISWISCTQS